MYLRTSVACMQRPARTVPRTTATAAVAVGVLLLAACGGTATESGASDQGACPAEPSKVVVTTNVWGSVVDQLAGECAEVTTIITSPSADPHDFEPTAQTSAAFAAADLAVINGLGYDEWANKILASLGSSAPTTVDLGADVGLKVGDNPHIWYSPTYVQESATAVTSALKGKLPTAATYFDDQGQKFSQALQPYLNEVEAIKTKYSGTPIGSTESIFVYMAEATDLDLTTPPGFMTAIANDSDPPSQDVQSFTEQLSNGTDKALVYNTQTDGGLPDQMRDTAKKNNVPVVDVTETLTPKGASFQDWQLKQLQDLMSALGGQ